MNFRDFLFIGKDALNGFKIHRHIKEIEKSLKTGENAHKVKQILEYSNENVPFYKKLNIKEFRDLPVVDKVIIKSNINDFISYKYKRKKLKKITTSGSTGTPFTVYQNKNKKLRNLADTLVFERNAGYRLGDRMLYVKIWTKEKMSHPLIYWAQNMIPIDAIKLDDNQISNILNDIKRNKNKTHCVIGYVSALEQVIRFCDKNNITDLEAKFSTVITMSESLDTGTKDKLGELFKCPVVARYSNLENGILAQQLSDGGNSFVFNSASYFIEILDLNNDTSLKEGEKGRIVITDLYNYAMPMLRYDTGDIGSIEHSSNGVLLLKTIEGRKLDVLFDSKGNIVSSYIMYKNMWKYPEIMQYQLIQTGQKDYLFKINCKRPFEKEEQLTSEFKEYLGSDSNFKIEYVDEIVLLDSGKRRKTVNLYKNTI
ncbi:MAG: phenylacetate--CoA ligase family protein [Bacteroidales bacterium]|jgi:phenylacetate-CoA ligase|nr:phenylacetate--CoA ligase family protein [Bacteroidales bacterium]